MTERAEKTDFKELVSHLKELTNALTVVHGDLYWLAMQTPEVTEKQNVPAAELNVDMLAELKTAVDDMRLLLWQYIETATALDPQGMREGLQAQRLQRVSKFLQVLRDRLVHSVDEQPVSFIERITAKVKEHLPEKAA